MPTNSTPRQTSTPKGAAPATNQPTSRKTIGIRGYKSNYFLHMNSSVQQQPTAAMTVTAQPQSYEYALFDDKLAGGDFHANNNGTPTTTPVVQYGSSTISLSSESASSVPTTDDDSLRSDRRIDHPETTLDILVSHDSSDSDDNLITEEMMSTYSGGSAADQQQRRRINATNTGEMDAASSKLLTKPEDHYASRIDRILEIMNTAEPDQHAITQPHHSLTMRKLNRQPDTDTPSASVCGDQLRPACPYSYYALFFMLAANVVGFGLSLSFQVLLLLKMNGHRLLCCAWSHWSSRRRTSGEGGRVFSPLQQPLIVGLLLMPAVVAGLLAYGVVWALLVTNRFLLSAVPRRVAQMVNFNIQIVY